MGFINKVFSSPTLMTWASFASRSLSLILVLPLILTKLSTPDIALWYLFGTALTIQGLSYTGFGATFVRVISFAYGGASIEKLKFEKDEKDKEVQVLSKPNWEGIGEILSNMNYIYRYLTIFFLLICCISSLLLIRPISMSSNIVNGWMGWFIIVIGSLIALRGSLFMVYLEGVNEIALVRRWDALFGLIGMVSNFLVLWIFGNLISLVISSQFWMIANIPRNYVLCTQVKDSVFGSFSLKPMHNKIVFQGVWDSAWKSIVGTFMNMGMVQASNLIYAQIGSSTMLASYLMGQNLLRQITRFSQAPFYSKLPLMARLRKQRDLKQLAKVATRGMSLTYWIFIFCAIILSVLGSFVLDFIGSNAPFPPILLWTFMVFGMLIERFGAMHIQLYSTTNNILWHISNGVMGTIYIGVSIILLPYIDVYAFPIGLILAGILFNAWYCASYSYNSLNTNFWKFDSKVFLPVLLLSTIIFTIILIYEFI